MLGSTFFIGQLLLIAMIVGLGIYIFALRSMLTDRLAMLLLAAIGVFLVAWPGLSESLARVFGIGRGALAYPDFAHDVLEKDELNKQRICKMLTYCTYLMRRKDNPLGQWPTGCPPFDKEGYGEIMKQARATARAAASSTKAG